MTFRVEAIAARVTDFHRQPLAGLPALLHPIIFVDRGIDSMSHYIILALRRCRSGHLRCAHQHVISAEASWTHALLVLLQGRSFTFLSDHLIFGLSSSCERVEFMFALVMRLTPVSILAGTCSPFEAASAV